MLKWKLNYQLKTNHAMKTSEIIKWCKIQRKKGLTDKQIDKKFDKLIKLKKEK